jgi:beta-glucosidase
MEEKTDRDNARYLDPTHPVEDRVSDLLSRMTLDEKLAQLSAVWVFELLDDGALSPEKAQAQLGDGIGQITRPAGATSLEPAASAKLANSIQAFLVENTRLGIPAIVHEECCSGYMARGATCFPQIIGLASTWEPELAERMTSAIKTQMRTVGAHQGLSPVLDVTRDPRWGRVEETFGEDPYLVSRMGVSYVKGLQGTDLKHGVVATGKHFVAYGLSEGGRNCAPVHLATRELHEVFLMPFEAAIREANLASIMNAYHELDGVPCGASRELLTELLRGRLGFDGIVVSDYFAIRQLLTFHHVVQDDGEAANLALEAGIDIELPGRDCYGQPLRGAVQNGTVDESLIDQAVRRVLRTKFSLGLFENPTVDAGQVAQIFDLPEPRTLAREIAQKSIVLLKNEGNLLPLQQGLSSIAIIGPNADSARSMFGDYSYPAHIEMMMGDRPDLYASVPSVLDGIKRQVSPETRVHFAQGCDVSDESRHGFAEAVAVAQEADVAILVLGGRSGLTLSSTCGEARDRADIGLPGVQKELVQAVHATGTPVVAVLINGRPPAIPWIAEHVPAILEAWLPGEEGGSAIADVLLGRCTPGGKLPITLPRSAGQIPVYYSHKPSGGRSQWYGDYVSSSAKPLFPFGYGLSYTRFTLDNLRIAPHKVDANGDVQISVDIENSGERTGDEVVQLYVRLKGRSVTRPVKELKGFKRVTLGPGEKRTVTFTLAVSQLGFYNREMTFAVEPGAVGVMVGNSSDDTRLTGEFDVVGETTDVSSIKRLFSEVHVHP